MKYNHNLMQRIKTYLMFISIPLNLLSAPGCQDNSKHLERGTIDYKQWHYVTCNCPCEKQYQIRPDGHCSECEHLRTRIRLVHPKEVSATKILNIAQLKAWSRKKIE
jgi:hypothetical protein